MPEAVTTATHLDGLIPQDIDSVVKTRFEHQFGANLPFARDLRTWGEAETVTIKSRTFQPKERARGVFCVMIGYSAEPPRVDHLDVMGRLTPSMNGNQEFTAPAHSLARQGRRTGTCARDDVTV
jgi:hypothetical protein